MSCWEFNCAVVKVKLGGQGEKKKEKLLRFHLKRSL